MKRYIITQPKEHGVYFRGDSIFTQINIKGIILTALTDPSEVSISIYGPCGDTLVNAASMPSSAVGVYEYDYDISLTADYGVYSIKIETTTYDSLSYYNFVVFPWDVISRIRSLSGAFQQSDMSDYKLSLIAWDAYIETLGEIYDDVKDATPICDPSVDVYIDGTNKKFQLGIHPIADADGDTVVTGFGEHSCATDVTLTYMDNDGNIKKGRVKVNDAEHGLVELTNESDAAFPIDTKWMRVTYSVESPTYNESLMREAVAYLAAYKTMIALKSLDKATLGDLQSNRSLTEKRFLTRYEDLIEQIGFPMIGSGD